MVPLAERMRPQTIDEFIGQSKIVGDNKIINRILQVKKPRNLILWGPAGCGKTTLARLIAKSTNADMIELSAVSSGKKDVEAVLERARHNLDQELPTILFLDEIHRFNKAQQDLFLPYLENGLITLIGATTENPSFEIITPLLSRSQLIILEALDDESIKKIIHHAIKKLGVNKKITTEALDFIAFIAQGDARRALGLLETALDLSPKLDLNAIKTASSQAINFYDKKADNHYDLISAFIKSLRGSDAEAALYYMIRMLNSGEDPKFIARRLIIFASEDIGLAGNGALGLANDCFDAVTKIGMPEAQIVLAHVVAAFAKSKKSRESYNLMIQFKDLAQQFPNLPVPLHIRNAPTKLMKGVGYGKGYHWQAGFKHPDGFLPPQIQDILNKQK
ncbi:MAG: replication-associated recombination protein A [Candidatus Saccharibacteria bacterium]|nr:replication-associated recombination protein A [Candidatus Saccharibacteria bacterium]